ncbi:MAG: WbqC family protein [Bacteroidia bacterium]|nr:WbqC family protein [Bacteroidia bacterium]
MPWLGFFDRIDASDLCIILDNVLLDTNSKTRFTNRNKIRTKEGWIWLTLPIKTKGLYGNILIKDIELADDKWQSKHLKSIEHNYHKAPFFEDYIYFLRDTYNRKWVKMQDLLDEMLIFFFQKLSIRVPTIKASTIPVKSKKDALILDLCKYVNASVYYSGIFGRSYLNLEKFKEANIDVFFHNYKHPSYQQVFPNFEPYMCILDLLFNHGEDSMNVIRQGRNFVKN